MIGRIIIDTLFFIIGVFFGALVLHLLLSASAKMGQFILPDKKGMLLGILLFAVGIWGVWILWVRPLFCDEE